MKNVTKLFAVGLSAAMVIGCASSKMATKKTAAEIDVVPAYTPSMNLDVSPVQLPPVTEYKLDNGMRVYFFKADEVPAVSIRLTVPGAALFNSVEKPGVNSMMADLLDAGTETRSAQQIAEEIEFVGGGVGAGSGNNSTFAYAYSLTRDIELAFELMSDIVLHPTFPEEEIQREKMMRMSGLMRSLDNAGAIAGREWAKWVYGADHPYGQPNGGTMQSIQMISRDDLVGQYNKMFVPDWAYLTVSGDFDEAQVRELINTYFGGWATGEVPETVASNPEDLPGGEVLLINKEDAVQSEIKMGYLLTPYNMGEDEFAYSVMNYMFGGGGFSSRLMLKVRNEMGLTYGIGAGLAPRQQRGAYTIGTSTRNEKTAIMIDAILGQFERTINEGFTEKELSEAKSYLIGSYPQRFETPSDISENYIGELLFSNEDPSKAIAAYRKGIADVTMEDVNAMAKKYLRPDSIRMTIVGKASEIKPLIEKYGNVKVVELSEISGMPMMPGM